MELIIALVALGVAIWQLKIQRDEIRIESRINTLLHVDQLISNRIELLEKIIEDKKQRKETWIHLAHSINSILKPVRNDVNNTLLEELKDHLPNHITLMELRESLGLTFITNPETSKSLHKQLKPHLSNSDLISSLHSSQEQEY